MEKDTVFEISKRKMAVIYYRKRVCRCLTSKVLALQKLTCGIPGADLRYKEYRVYFDELNKIWKKLIEKETLVFDEMIAAGVNAVEIDNVMRTIESYPVDEYTINQLYLINTGEIEETKRRIWSIGYNL